MFTPKNLDLDNLKERKERMRDKRKRIMKQAEKAAAQMRSDSLGSYTGTAHDGGLPEQDADDL